MNYLTGRFRQLNFFVVIFLVIFTLNQDVEAGCNNCVEPITEFPLAEDFEFIPYPFNNTFGIWHSIVPFNTWFVGTWRTPVMNTGPERDHTFEEYTNRGSYLYIRTSNSNSPGDQFIIESDCFDITGLEQPVFEFWYHMYGEGIGSLEIQISNNVCDSWDTLFYHEGEISEDWNFSELDLSNYTGQVTLRIVCAAGPVEGVEGETRKGNIAIDDLYIGEKKGACCTGDSCTTSFQTDCNDEYQGNGVPCRDGYCNECFYCISPVDTYPYSFDFEGNTSDLHVDGWMQIKNDDFDWSFRSGETLSENTGPSFDHTFGDDTGHYAYIYSAGLSGRQAILEGPCFDISSLDGPQFSFWYHMYGDVAGLLNVQVSNDNCQTWNTEFFKSGSQGDEWKQGLIDLSGYQNYVNIRFIATNGTSNQSDIAIDDFLLEDNSGACCKGNTCTLTTSVGCSKTGGKFQGENTHCTAVSCSGACCLYQNNDFTEPACLYLPESECGFTCDHIQIAEDLLYESYQGCFGDLSFDGFINGVDRGLVSANLGQTDPFLLCRFDMDGNGFITPSDRGFISANANACNDLPVYMNGSGKNYTSDYELIDDPRFPYGNGEYAGGETDCSSFDCVTINDECDGALEVFDGETLFLTYVGTDSPDVELAPVMENDLWFSYTATTNGLVTFDLCTEIENIHYSYLSIWENEDCPVTLNRALGFNRRGCIIDSGNSAKLTIQVVKDQNYLLRVGENWPHIETVGLLRITPGGACCLSTSECTLVSNELECDLLNGYFQGIGATCVSTTCQKGACCDSPNGNCNEVVIEECNEYFWGKGTVCSEVTCDEFCLDCSIPYSEFPYFEDFEDLDWLEIPEFIGIWIQSTHDDQNWNRETGFASNNHSAGPSTDHTKSPGSRFFIYSGTVSAEYYDQFVLEGPCFDISTLDYPELNFWYNTNRNIVGTLMVQITDDECFTWNTEFTTFGDQGNVWHLGKVDLTPYSDNVNIRFLLQLNVVNNNPSPYASSVRIAIDDISIVNNVGACCIDENSCTEIIEEQCNGYYAGDMTTCDSISCVDNCLDCSNVINTFPYLEDFESLVPGSTDLNAWFQYTTDQQDFLVHQGPTPSQYTGPFVDHTLGTPDGNYIYTEISDDVIFQDQFIIEGPCFNTFSLVNPQFRFWYHMNGARMGWLEVQVLEFACGKWNTVFYEFGNQTDVWRQGIIDLKDYSSIVNIRFIYTSIASETSELSHLGDLALDDFSLIDAGVCCQQGGLCSERSQEECDTFLGDYHGDGTTCSLNSCITGACCLQNGSCKQQSQASCESAGNTYLGDNEECIQGVCQAVGACCSESTGCEVLQEVMCDPEYFQGVGTSCSPLPEGCPDDYCSSTHEDGDCNGFDVPEEVILNIVLWLDDPPPGETGYWEHATGCEDGGELSYGDYTNIDPPVVRRDSHNNIFITASSCWDGGDENGMEWESNINVYFDWNNDLSFDDEHEFVFVGSAWPIENCNGTGIEATTIFESNYFIVPDDAVLGPTRMRVIIERNNPAFVDNPASCGHRITGETEDYKIVIIEELE